MLPNPIGTDDNEDWGGVEEYDPTQSHDYCPNHDYVDNSDDCPECLGHWGEYDDDEDVEND